jgi:hypothetical protein
VTATIYASNISNNKTGSYIDLRVSNTYQPTQTSGTANKTNDYLKESTGRKKQRRYTVQIPDAEVFQKLIDAKENTTGEPSWIVRDVPIYAYRNYDGKIKSSDKLLSMLNDSEISLKIPPEYSLNLRQNFLQKSFTRVFDIGDKPSYIFYVAIARYIKKGENWTGEWLQTGSSGNPFWSKAVKSGN